VFESVVRDQVLSEVEDEMTRLRHAVIIQIVEGAVQEIEHGSFYRVLEVFKGRDAGLVEELTLPQLKSLSENSPLADVSPC